MNIALIAHDKKKNDMIELAIKYKDTLAKHTLFATGTTGTLVMGETGLNIIFARPSYRPTARALRVGAFKTVRWAKQSPCNQSCLLYRNAQRRRQGRTRLEKKRQSSFRR